MRKDILNNRYMYKLLLFSFCCLLFKETAYSQQRNPCEIQKNEIVPNIILNSKRLINPAEATSQIKITFNEEWIDQARRQGYYCREQYVRDISREDLRNNSNLRRQIEGSGKESRVPIDNTTFYENGKIFEYIEESTQFHWWLTVRPSDYRNEDFRIVAGDRDCNRPLRKEFKTVNLSDFIGVELKIKVLITMVRSFSQ